MAVKWPEGVLSAGVSSGIKRSGKLDLGLLVTEKPATWAGTFTQNAAAAAPVAWCRERAGSPIRAIVVNSGNANACTGRAGSHAVPVTAEAVAASVGCTPAEVLVASTGPIGVQLPIGKLIAGIPRALKELGPEIGPFSRSILTTDKKPKIASAKAGGATVVGVAKGSAMLAPNMATMLAFVVTDADIGQGSLNAITAQAVGTSFNRICVDACESTNDSFFVVTTGAGPLVAEDVLAGAITSVCRELALQMVDDSEGGSRVVRIEVAGAHDDSAGAALGKAVASSALWRAAVHGGDPNWGRILAALGSRSPQLDLDEVDVWIGSEQVFTQGEPSGDLAGAARAMRADEILVRCVVGTGPGSAEVLSTDLSPAYVELNAGGMS